MKTQDNFSSIRVLAISVLCMMSQFVSAQHPAEGNWEGYFMEDFKTIVKLEADGKDSYTGSIQMFDGMGEIQNDELSKITIESCNLVFYIEAKETAFKGSFDKEFSKFTGEFTFPDKSLHPIELQKVEPGDSTEAGSDWM